MTTVEIRMGRQPQKIDLDRLSPTARAMAEALADATRFGRVIWMEADAPIRETTPHWEVFYTEAEAALPERRPWAGWSTVMLGADEDPHDRLEREATKIPPGWHVYGAHPHQPVASMETAALTREATAAQVVDYLRTTYGREISTITWRSYAQRDQAPAPVRHAGRTPIWDLNAVDAWVNR